jgi:hypothetical protein
MARAMTLAGGRVKRITDDYLSSSDFNGLSLGRYGDPSKLHPRNPRLNFEEASVIL